MELAIESRLTGHAGTAELIGTRVYPVIAPQNVVDPFVTYQRISGDRIRSLSGPSGMSHPRFQIDCWGDTYAKSKAVAEQVRFAFDGFRGTVGGIRVGSAILANESDFYEADPKLYRTSLDFIFLHDEETN